MGNTILGSEDGIVDDAVVTGGGDGGEDAAVDQSSGDGAFDYSGMIGAEGALSENWRDGLPEDLRGEKCLDQIKNIGGLVKSYVSAQKMLGGNRISVPGENATDEERNAFYKAIGRPDKAEDYKHDGVELPKGVELGDEDLKAFREFAHKHGMTQEAYQAALQFDVDRVRASVEAEEAAANAEYEETLGKLQAEFGGNMKTVVAQCNKAMVTFGLQELFTEKGLLNNYTMIKALATIGGKISESKLKGDDSLSTAADPQARLNEILADRNGAYYDRENPGHDEAVQEVSRLLKVKSGK